MQNDTSGLLYMATNEIFSQIFPNIWFSKISTPTSSINDSPSVHIQYREISAIRPEKYNIVMWPESPPEIELL